MMNYSLQHAIIRTTDINKAKEFYVTKLGLEVLEEAKNFFACKAGVARLSFFGGYEKQSVSEDAKTGVSLILRVDNLDKAIEGLKNKGIEMSGDIIDIPNFHRFQELEDPDGTILFLAEYYVEPV
jgi:predicted enzyme related to lactoylglutathione lyase